MEIYAKFKSGDQRKLIEEVLRKSNSSIDELATLAHVVPRSVRDWRREKFSIPLSVVTRFSEKFNIDLPEDIDTLTERWKEAKAQVSHVGGYARYNKCGAPGTQEGRQKGGHASQLKRQLHPELYSNCNLAKSFPIPHKSDELAEFVGILLGDGSLTNAHVTITLNGEADSQYIPFVTNLGNQLFGSKPKSFKHKHDKAITLYYNGVNLVHYLKAIGLRVGNKVKQQVGVPTWIKSSKVYSAACVRGLMDTDGGVFLHRYKVNNKLYCYKKISFSNRSIPLLTFMANTLQSLAFTPKMITNIPNKKVWLYNTNEVQKYLEIIGTHNPRLLKYSEDIPIGSGDGLLNHNAQALGGFDPRILRQVI